MTGDPGAAPPPPGSRPVTDVAPPADAGFPPPPVTGRVTDLPPPAAAQPPPPPPGPPTPRTSPSDDRSRLRRIVVVLTLVNTILAAIVAGLEVDAGSRAADANRESERLAAVAAGQLAGTGERETYEMGLVSDWLRYSMEGDAAGLSALELQQAGDTAGAAEMTARQLAARARADRTRTLSTVFTDPDLAPSDLSGVPAALQKLLDRLNAVPEQTVAQQNAASDEYSLWDGKSSSYVAILSALAVAFFLLGVAQIARRMRPVLAAVASGVMAIAVVWTVLVAVGGG